MELSMTTPPLRLFFALPCPPTLATAMAAWRDTLPPGGKPVAAENLHLTLAFLGNQPRGKLEDLKSLASSVRVSPFALCLDQLMRWHNGLLHLTTSQPPAALLELERQLRGMLLGAGYELEARAFHPHLTLARHYPHHPSATPPTFDWPADSFALFVSENTAKGSRYRVLGQWPLRP
jgi:2'-5' RNA ligase